MTDTFKVDASSCNNIDLRLLSRDRRAKIRQRLRPVKYPQTEELIDLFKRIYSISSTMLLRCKTVTSLSKQTCFYRHEMIEIIIHADFHSKPFKPLKFSCNEYIKKLKFNQVRNDRETFIDLITCWNKLSWVLNGTICFLVNGQELSKPTRKRNTRERSKGIMRSGTSKLHLLTCIVAFHPSTEKLVLF